MRTKLLFLFCVTFLITAKAQTIKVFFIGNSFTYYNDMPGMVESLALSAGKQISVTSYTAGGVYMETWVDDPTTMQILRSEQWDYVILQDNAGYWLWPNHYIQPPAPTSNKSMLDSIKKINPCSKVIWFAGWGFEGGRPDIWPGDNSVSMIQRVLNNYRNYNNQSFIKQIVAPIGNAWITSLQQKPGIQLWGPDAIHPLPAGTYAGASVLYSTIYKDDPHGISYTAGLNPLDAEFLRDAAWRAVIDSMPLNNLSAFTPPVTLSGSTLNSSGGGTYQWYLNGSAIGGATSSSYAPSSEGLYGVMVTDGQGCTLQSRNEYLTDAGTVSISNPIETMCNSTITPTVSIGNYGLTPLASATIEYAIDNGTPSIYNWNGLINQSGTSNVNLPSLPTVTDGAHTFTVKITAANGSADVNPVNNAVSIPVFVATSGAALPYSEGFEGSFPPANWRIKNPDNAITWAQTSAAASSGSACIYMNDKDYSFNGAVDELVLPNFNINSVAAPLLTFQVAYQLLSDPSQSPNWSDTLAVLISTDCGVTYDVIYKKFGTGLVTTSPAFSSTPFFPTSNQWRLETVNLNTYANSTNAIIKFRHTTDFENNMFIDDVNVTGVTSVNNEPVKQFNLSPNPSNGNLNIVSSNILNAGCIINIYNVMGELVKSIQQVQPEKTVHINTSDWSNGIYTIAITTENGERSLQKFVLEK